MIQLSKAQQEVVDKMKGACKLQENKSA